MLIISSIKWKSIVTITLIIIYALGVIFSKSHINTRSDDYANPASTSKNITEHNCSNNKRISPSPLRTLKKGDYGYIDYFMEISNEANDSETFIDIWDQNYSGFIGVRSSTSTANFTSDNI